MINILEENDKHINFEIKAEAYYPKYIIESAYEKGLTSHLIRNYDFCVDSDYDNTTEDPSHGVLLNTSINTDTKEDKVECSFTLSPDKAIELSNALRCAAEHAIRMDHIKTDRKLSKQILSNSINFKQVDHISISLLSNENNISDGRFVYHVIVKTFTKSNNNSKSSKLNDDASFSFELNLYKILYSYAMNMIKNETVVSKRIKPKNMKTTIHYFEAFKQFIIMQIIGDIYIDLTNYPNKSLDKLFIFEEEYNLSMEMDNNICRMLEIIKKNMESVLDENNLVKAIPIKIHNSTDTSNDENK